MAACCSTTDFRGAREHRAFEMPKGPPLTHHRLGRLGGRPFTFGFPPCDEDWTRANLPVIRAAIGVLAQDGPDALEAHREAAKANPLHTREMVWELNARITHFELLAKMMRQAREKLEAIEAYARVTEAAGAAS